MSRYIQHIYLNFSLTLKKPKRRKILLHSCKFFLEMGIQFVRIGVEVKERGCTETLSGWTLSRQDCLQEGFYEGNDDVFQLGLGFLRQRALLVNGSEQSGLVALEVSKEICWD